MLVCLQLLDTPEEKDFFRTLYEKNRGPMLRKALSLLKRRDLAEDAVHNAFLRTVRHLDKFQRAEPEIQGYMCLAYVTNEAKKLLRDETTHPRDPLADAETAEETLPAGENPYVRAELRAQLAGAIINLEEKYRDVVMLRLVQGFTTRETAKLLDISESLVTTRLNRARKLLMEVLQDE